MLWNDSISVHIEEASQQYINMICMDASGKNRMRITFIHAPNGYRERMKLWDKLRQVSLINSLHWLCLWDFNEVLYHWEKVGKRMVDYYRLNVFRECLNDCYLIEMESKGCAYM